MKRFVLLALLFLLCLGGVFLARAAQDVNRYRDTFSEGVSIEGVALVGHTYEGALDYFHDLYGATLETPITLTFGEQSWTFVPSQVGASVDVAAQISEAWAYGREGGWLDRLREIRRLREEPQDLRVTLVYDRDALSQYVAAIKAQIDVQPVDATAVMTGYRKFAVTQSSLGHQLDADALRATLETAIVTGNTEPIFLTPEVLQPTTTSEQAQNSVALLAEYTTSLENSSSNRINNVRLALAVFNNLVIEPGATVSFNRTVGKRTEERGFLPATEYAGSSVTQGIGGGICQASTTLYNVLIRAGLRIVERHSHTMTVSYVEPSQDAAVSDNDKDLVFANDTEGKLYLFTQVNAKDKTTSVWLYGTPKHEGYTVQIVSEIIQRDIYGSSIEYKDDLEGRYAIYTDETVPYLEDVKPGMRSKAYRLYINDSTGLENFSMRETLSSDYYAPQSKVYWRGIQKRGG